MSHRAIFRGDPSNCCRESRDMTIFYTFQDGGRPPYWFVVRVFGPHTKGIWWLLANVNVSSRSLGLYAVARPSVVSRLSVVGNARAPYSGGSNFRQYFYGIRYPGYPLTSTENFTEIVRGEPLRRGS